MLLQLCDAGTRGLGSSVSDFLLNRLNFFLNIDLGLSAGKNLHCSVPWLTFSFGMQFHHLLSEGTKLVHIYGVSVYIFNNLKKR